MKRTIRLTESELINVIKRVISEDVTATTGGGYTQNAKTAIKLIEQGIAYWGGTDENTIAKGVYTIKTKEDYAHVLDHAKRKGFKTIMQWIGTDWGHVSHSSNFAGLADSANKQIMDLQRHLEQFNKAETAATFKSFLAPKN